MGVKKLLRRRCAESVKEVEVLSIIRLKKGMKEEYEKTDNRIYAYGKKQFL